MIFVLLLFHYCNHNVNMGYDELYAYAKDVAWHSSLNIVALWSFYAAKFKALSGILSLTVTYQSEANLAYLSAHLI